MLVKDELGLSGGRIGRTGAEQDRAGADLGQTWVEQGRTGAGSNLGRPRVSNRAERGVLGQTGAELGIALMLAGNHQRKTLCFVVWMLAFCLCVTLSGRMAEDAARSRERNQVEKH